MEKPWFRKVIKGTWIGFAVILLSIPLYLFCVSIDLLGLFGGMPNIREIENPKNDLSSELISADGVSLGRYFRYNRSQVSYDELSEDLVNVLIISEDHRFKDHSGLDGKSMMRAIFGALTFTEQGGGSTLTQQLAKALFTRNAYGKSLDGHLAKLGEFPARLIQKNKEWIISVYLKETLRKKRFLRCI